MNPLRHIFKTKYIIIFSCIFLATPVVLNFFYLGWGTKVTNGDTNSWLGFLGSYVGSIIGGILTLVGVVITLTSEKDKSEQEQEEKTKRLLVLLNDETIKNLSKIRRLDTYNWSQPTNLIFDSSNHLESTVWNQWRSESLILLDTATITQLSQTYELVEEYKISFQKEQSDFQRTKTALSNLKDKIDSLL